MSVLRKPIVTEKMSQLGEKAKKHYGFIVDYKASKPEIKDAIEKLYNVKVDSVRTMRQLGKKRNRFTKTGFIEGKSSNFKKAFVTLKEGEIDFYKNI